MGELVGAIVVATGLLALVVRDVLVVHAKVVRQLESGDGTRLADSLDSRDG